jgi:hypothetical protein
MAPHRVPDGREVRGACACFHALFSNSHALHDISPFWLFIRRGRILFACLDEQRLYLGHYPECCCILIPEMALGGLSLDRECSDSMFT